MNDKSLGVLDMIVASAMDAIITVDDSQRIVQFNAAAEHVFGCPSEEAIGAPLDTFIPQRYRAAHTHHMERFREAGSSARRMAGSRVVTGLRRNGEEFPIDASISQVDEGGRHYYTVILRDVTERVRAEDELRASREEIKRMALTSNRVREQEKGRVARELHDELGQSLTALKMDAAWLRENLSAPGEELAAKLAEMQALLDGTVAATRRISADLRPLVLDDLGLVAAAEWLAQNFTTRTGLPCELAIAQGLDLDEPHATTVFRVLQESLTNIAKHAGATQVEVTLGHEDGSVVLEVRDDGAGFDPRAPRPEGSFGLAGMRDRAALLGGDVSVESAPGRGTTIVLRIPLREGA